MKKWADALSFIQQKKKKKILVINFTQTSQEKTKNVERNNCTHQINFDPIFLNLVPYSYYFFPTFNRTHVMSIFLCSLTDSENRITYMLYEIIPFLNQTFFSIVFSCISKGKKVQGWKIFSISSKRFSIHDLFLG